MSTVNDLMSLAEERDHDPSATDALQTAPRA